MSLIHVALDLLVLAPEVETIYKTFGDKEPPVSTIWTLACVVGALGFLSSWWRIQLTIAIMLLTTVAGAIRLHDLHLLGFEFLHEGFAISYLAHNSAALVFALLLHACGWAVARRRV
jgi:hypothetical protein